MSTRPTDLVLVPGLLCSPALFSPQIAALGNTCRVHVADHTRHASLPEIARDILGSAPPTFALAGLSMGGYIAYEMIRQAPQRIERLALIATNARADRPDQLKTRRILIGLARTMGVRAVQAMLLTFLLHPSRQRDPALTELVMGMAEWTGERAFERQQAAIMGRPDNRAFLAQINCPTVIVVGAEDAITPVKVHQEIQAGIAGSRLEVVADCGHLATLEQPERLSAILACWLDG